MDVQMRYRLTSGFPDIDANIEAIGLIVFLDLAFCDLNAFELAHLFLVTRLKPGRHMTPRNHQRMTGGDRKTVPHALD